MRLVKSTFENFIDKLLEVMEGKTLLVIADAIQIEMEKSLAGNLRQILLYRTKEIDVSRGLLRLNRKMVDVVLSGWCDSLLVMTLLLSKDESEGYDAEIILNGRRVSPYDETLTEYINKFRAEFDKCKANEFHIE